MTSCLQYTRLAKDFSHCCFYDTGGHDLSSEQLCLQGGLHAAVTQYWKVMIGAVGLGLAGNHADFRGEEL